MKALSNDQKTAIAELATHGPIGVFEFRGETVDNIEYLEKDKEGNRTDKKAVLVKHTIAAEFAASGEQVKLDVYHKRDSTVTKTEFQKGDLFVAILSGYKLDKGTVTARIVQYRNLDNVSGGIVTGETATAESQDIKNYDLKAKPAKAS